MGVNHTTYVELRKRYNACWTPPPTEFPNESFSKPEPSAMWARFNIIDGIEQQLDIGDAAKTFRLSAMVVVQLFAPLDTGTIDILLQADIVADGFRNWCGTTVTCKESTVRKIGNDGFGWYQVNVLIPFKVDALH
jgi:hypothetical protein